MQKISKWLEELDSHTIYSNDKLVKDFRAKTGKEPKWSTTTIGKLRELEGSFKGPMNLKGNDSEVVACGWIVAEGLERVYAETRDYAEFHGRGSAFRASIEALKRKGF